MTGVYNRLELWDENQWRKYKKNTEQKGDDIAEQLGELGL